MYRYGLKMVEVDEHMAKENYGWVHRALKAILKTKANLHKMAWKNVCTLLQWNQLEDLFEKEARGW